MSLQKYKVFCFFIFVFTFTFALYYYPTPNLVFETLIVIVIPERDLGTGIDKDTVIEPGLHIVGRHVGNLRAVTTGRLLQYRTGKEVKILCNSSS